MIVKDEEHIIHECLDSMIPYIDRFDITDTGSTDKTMDIIREWGEKNNIPGTIHQMEWLGFGKSRTQSLKNCQGNADYAWVIDADDKVDGNFKYPNDFGVADGYALNIHRGDFNWWRNQIFKVSSGWEYIGVIHEYADCVGKREAGETPVYGKIEGDYHITARTMGNRTQAFENDEKAKYRHDAEILLDCLTNPENPNYEPNNLRYLFYIAQSYFDAGQPLDAYDWYKKRAEEGGWEEEQWYSVYRMGLCMSSERSLHENPDAWQIAQDHYMQAYNIRPWRAEPLITLARTHRLNENPRLAFIFARQALSIPFPKDDILFLSHNLYNWEILDEVGAVAHAVGEWALGYNVCKKLLEDNLFPDEHRERIVTNFKSYENHLVQEQEKQMKQKVESEKQEKEAKENRIKIQKLREQEKKRAKRLNKKATKIRSN
jgi:hypothetical protein